MRGRNEEPVGVLKAAPLNSIDKDDEGVSEGDPRFGSRADEIGDRYSTGRDHAIAQASHPPCMFDTILMGKAQIAMDAGAHLVGVEQHGAERRADNARKRRLSRAWQTHDQKLAVRAWLTPRVTKVRFSPTMMMTCLVGLEVRKSFWLAPKFPVRASAASAKVALWLRMESVAALTKTL
jgi:hypothetical protein